jgi:ribosomal protein S28E/S33
MTPPSGNLTGRFSYDVASGTWEWDEEVFRIHGLQPGSITPTTDYMLECKHPEDRARVAEVLARASATGEVFSVSYRIISADGVERRVVLVCEGGMCEDHVVTTISGYYIDLTTDFREEGEALATEAVAASAEHRATIEQAKGSLMLAYGLDAAQAFAMLKWWSSSRNVKIRELAERLVEIARTGEATDTSVRNGFDALLHDIATGQDAARTIPEAEQAV